MAVFFVPRALRTELRAGAALLALLSADAAFAQTENVENTAAQPQEQSAPATPGDAVPDAPLPQSEPETVDEDLADEGIEEDDDNAIIVLGRHEPGALITDTPPEQVLDSTTIQGYGASSIDELINATSSLTQSGRGSGRPIMLVNGRRISSFREIHNLPPEAIEKMEVYPEEVAVAQGYRPDQRVVNFILKKNFRSVTLEAEAGMPTAGGYAAQEFEASLLRLGSNGRTNITATLDQASPLFESERGIVYQNEYETLDRALVPIPPGTAIGDYRTLRSKSLEAKLDGTVQRYLTDDISGSLNLTYELSNSNGVSGASGYWNDAAGLCAIPSALLCDGQIDTENRSRIFHAGAGFNGDIGRWRWNVSANHDRTNTTSLVDRRPLVDGTLLAEEDVSKGQDVSTDATAVFNGPLFQMPAGQARASLTTGFVARDYEGWSDRASGYSTTDLKRQEGRVAASIDVPIADAGNDVLAFLGDLTINANAGYNHLSDFGGLFSWGAGVNWSPVERLNLSASIAVDEDAPSMSQLGSPVVINPNRTVYDFRTGQTVLVESVSGGNASLRAPQKREWKLGLNYNVPWIEQLRFSANYYNNHTDDPIGSLPLLTPQVEAAFPDRVVRDAAGNLIRIDNRPLNYDSRENSNLRYGFTFFKSFGQPPRGQGTGAAQRGSGRGPAAGAPRSGGGMRGGMMRGPGGGGSGRWNLSLFHTVRLSDTINMGPGLPVLDLMNGDATGSAGGTSRHLVDLDAGWFNKGIGLRGNARYYSETIVGTALEDQLRFGELLTFNLTAFVNFDQQTKLVEDMPFLKGSRLRLSINNITNATQTVKNRYGIVPLTYQSGFMDPRGRYIELSFRKMF